VSLFRDTLDAARIAIIFAIVFAVGWMGGREELRARQAVDTLHARDRIEREIAPEAERMQEQARRAGPGFRYECDMATRKCHDATGAPVEAVPPAYICTDCIEDDPSVPSGPPCYKPGTVHWYGEHPCAGAVEVAPPKFACWAKDGHLISSTRQCTAPCDPKQGCLRL
jgi:hypothetical protein